MHKPAITYGQLYEVLHSFGFVERVEKGNRRLYAHKKTGAVMSLPDSQPTVPANATYIEAVRTVLSNFEIADEVEFASKLQKAS